MNWQMFGLSLKRPLYRLSASNRHDAKTPCMLCIGMFYAFNLDKRLAGSTQWFLASKIPPSITILDHLRTILNNRVILAIKPLTDLPVFDQMWLSPYNKSSQIAGRCLREASEIKV